MDFKELKKIIEKSEGTFFNTKDGDIEVKEYLPIWDKHSLITSLVPICVEERHNAKIKRILNSELALYKTLAEFYCNIKFEENKMDTTDYDFLDKNKFRQWLKKMTSGDSSTFVHLFNLYIDIEIEAYNSFANVMINNIPDAQKADAGELKELLKKVEDIDPNNMEVIKELQKLNKIEKEEKKEAKSK